MRRRALRFRPGCSPAQPLPQAGGFRGGPFSELEVEREAHLDSHGSPRVIAPSLRVPVTVAPLSAPDPARLFTRMRCAAASVLSGRRGGAEARGGTASSRRFDSGAVRAPGVLRTALTGGGP